MNSDTQHTLVVGIIILLLFGMITLGIWHEELNDSNYENCIEECAMSEAHNQLEVECINNCKEVLNCEEEGK